jgi:phytoene synthase
LKLAWWRDRFGEAAERWPRGEPLLARLVEWGENASLLQELPDAWEALLNDELTQPVIREHAHGRGAAWAAAATQCGQEAFASEAARAGACWALADLHENTARPEEREAVVAILQQARGTAFDLPRALRPLTMLGGLARRKAADPARGLAAGGGAYLAMLRIGLTGR